MIELDPLGVDQIYVQAKWCADSDNICVGDIRDLFWVLNFKKAKKGIFVTMSLFGPSATQIAKLMILYIICCRDEGILHLKNVDEEFFEMGHKSCRQRLILMVERNSMGKNLALPLRLLGGSG